jgi:hypothetical protein
MLPSPFRKYTLLIRLDGLLLSAIVAKFLYIKLEGDCPLRRPPDL